MAFTLWLSTQKASAVGRYIFGAIAISYPTFSHMLGFSAQVAYTSASSFLVIYAYVLLCRNDKSLFNYIASALCITVSLLTYQSIFIIFIALLFLDNFYVMLSWKFFKKFLVFISCVILAFILSVTIDSLLKYAYGLPADSYKLGMIGWLKNEPAVVLSSLYQKIAGIVSGKDLTYATMPVLVIPSFIIVFCGPRKLEKFFALLVMYVMLGAVFVVFGTYTPARLLFYVPVIYAGIFYLAFTHANIFGKYVVALCAVYVVLTNSSINTQFSMQTAFANQRDQLIAARVTNELYDSVPDFQKSCKSLLITGSVQGAPKFPDLGAKTDSEVHGASFWEWGSDELGSGNPIRIKNYLFAMGIMLPPLLMDGKDMPDYLLNMDIPLPPLMLDGELRNKILRSDAFKNMPSWPRAGFVNALDEVLVIKLS